MRGLRFNGENETGRLYRNSRVEGLCSFPLKEISTMREVDIFAKSADFSQKFLSFDFTELRGFVEIR